MISGADIMKVFDKTFNVNNILIYIKELIENEYSLHIRYFRNFMDEIIRMIQDVTKSFHDVFGRNIFNSY